MKATGGAGVDMVLNSLTGPGFKEASLDCCKEGARFVEMSKLNIWSVEEVQKLRPDVKYSVEDLSSQEEADQKRMENLIIEFDKYLNHPVHPLTPLPYVRFDVVDLRSALQYLEKAKQIGKVVCALPEPTTKENCEIEVKLFNDRSTYLVTGGCGGIGFEVMKWMCENGASTVVICGRNPPSPENQRQLEALNQQGKNIIVFQGDIGDMQRCREMIDWIKKELPPLRGIMHSAGCLADATIPNQTVEKFEITINPKVRGSWNLHKLTLDCPLEHFVLFSSGVALVGTMGQSNHAACNRFLDGLAYYRRSMGLAASSINWGQWGDVGVAAGKNIVGFYPFTTREGLNVLSLVMRTNALKVAPFDCDVYAVKALVPWTKLYLEFLTDGLDSATKYKGISSDAFWRELNAAGDDEERFSIIRKNLATIITHLLRLDEEIEPNQNFQDMGMDSLMMIELKNQVQSMLGPKIAVNASEMADCKTLNLTTQKLMDIIYSAGESSLKFRNELIIQDSKLWASVDVTNSQPPLPIQQVKVLFMTGCTGTLGPYILQQLTQYPQVEKVVCLVRFDKLKTGKDRLEDRLRILELLEKTEMEKVQVVEGDVAEDRFGLEENVYESLSGEVHAVIHCAVDTSHLELYGKGASKRQGIKAVNVDGMQRVLEFASKTLLKHVYNASTLLGAFYKSDGLELQTIRAIVSSEWPEDGDADEAPSFGYGISKFIADRLAAEAVKIGIPCKSFRFPKINGAKDTGRQELEHNHFFIKFVYFMQSGMMPDAEIPLQLYPVDTCAQITLSLFFNPEVGSNMFNIINPHFNLEAELGQLTPEYGPLFRITENLWQVVDEIEELKRVEQTNPDNLVPTFFILLNEKTKEIDIDLEPIMEEMGQLFTVKDISENPATVFKHPKVRSYLKENYGYPMRLVPYPEFVEQLKKDGNRIRLNKWIDFYTREDNAYKILDGFSASGEFNHCKKDRVSAMAKSLEHITKYIPNYAEIVPDGLKIVRQDFEFAIEHAVETFRRTDVRTTLSSYQD